MVSAWCQKWDSNWQLVKLQLTCEDNAFLWFYIGSSKEIIFFKNTQLKLVQKREPLFWKYTVCKLLKCNNKISLFDLIMRSQSGKGEVGMFVLSIHCMKRSPTSKNMILRKGKKNPWKVNFSFFQCMSYGSTFFSHTIWGTKIQAHHLDASSGGEYEIDLFAVDIKPEIYAQTVYSTS